MSARDLLMKTYAAFNARDIDAVLAVMDPEVDRDGLITSMEIRKP